MFESYCAIFPVKVPLAYPLRCLEVCWMWRHFMGSKLYASCGSFVSCFEIWREPLQKNSERRYEQKFETIWLVSMFWKAHRSQCIQVLHITILHFSQNEKEYRHMVQLMQYKHTIIQHSFLNTVLCKRCKRRAVMHNWENWFSLLYSLCEKKITRTFKCLQRKMKWQQFTASSYLHLFSIISFTFVLFSVSILFWGNICAYFERLRLFEFSKKVSDVWIGSSVWIANYQWPSNTLWVHFEALKPY